MLSIRGCRTNNLKNVNVDFPLNKITCVVGPSGSGKSSLVFHTLANESKRRFLNSTSSDMTFFEKVPQTADVDSVVPVLPVWVLPQHNPIVGSRLTLLDQFELTASLAQLYFDSNSTQCPIHLEKYENTNIDIIKKSRALLSADSDVLNYFIPKSLYAEYLSGYPVRSFSSQTELIGEFNEGDEFWELFRLKGNKLSELEVRLGEFPFLRQLEGIVLIVNGKSGMSEYCKVKNAKSCSICDKENVKSVSSLDELMPFSGVGACTVCKGYGATLDYSINKLVKFPTRTLKEGAVSILSYSKFKSYEKYFFAELKKEKIDLNETFEDNQEKIVPILMNGRGAFPGVLAFISWLEEKRYKSTVRIFLRSLQTENNCHSCNGNRINERAQKVLLKKGFPSFGEILHLSISQIAVLLENLSVTGKENIIKRINERLKLSLDFGLGSLKLITKLKELDANEYQKSLLIRYLTYRGSGSLFVLDEPSLGLSLDEQKVLMNYLKSLSKDNTVILVDHGEYVQRNSDHIIEVGPGAGELGGEIVYEGKFKGKNALKIEKRIKTTSKNFISFEGIEFNDYKLKKVEIPLGEVCVVSSFRESFSKKLLTQVILNEILLKIKNEKIDLDAKYFVKKISAIKNIDDVFIFENSLERSSGRSSVGTTLGLSPHLRKYYASLPVSKALDLKDGHFSANSDLGKCLTCDGKGVLEIDMQFMEDIILKCEDCDGKKLSRFYANISDGRYTVHQALTTPIQEVFKHIRVPGKAQRVLEYLQILNLGYLTLDRSLPSLSGGERLRVKFLNSLQSELKNSILFFSNISYGLSNIELEKVKGLLVSLSKANNTIILVDSHPIFSDFYNISLDLTV